jgi:hypothetical protein
VNTAGALELYAEKRGIPLSDADRRELHTPSRKGYVSRAVAPSLNSDTVVSGDVPWYYAENIHPRFRRQARRLRAEREVKMKLDDQKTAVTEGLRPLVRRTPQQRLDEMTEILVKEYQRTGVIADSILREIQGTYWQNGQTEVTTEGLRSIAAHYLEQATRMGQTTDPSYKHDIRTKEK